MTKHLLPLFLALTCLLTAPAWAQKKPMSAKARKAKIAAAATARNKAEAARRAEAARIAAAQPMSEGPDADELLRIDEVLTDATLRSDAETITHLLADEYIAVNSKGLVTSKKDWLGAIANDEGQCDINKGFEFVVRVYGNTGFVIHNTSFRGQLDGSNTTGEYRITRYFIRRNGKWLVAASNTTYVVPVRLTALAAAGKKAKKERKKLKNTYASEPSKR
ncbi:nuclear transport factor 2 family protein [Hymenobacter jeollabukensis]|uniref:Nuclear transport factor 2 family protein n=1 Tax=Hymenobacter jeollabukensis TaxID=2025313 RepID=A0A5R8WTD2_9BACT|nr:nuclear transport factor 2 family protein [Hymenobacter jeollabukensis]TLM95030.1 nuclear transport factor 2 family protein [Hymenobacter jeollabukensis]